MKARRAAGASAVVMIAGYLALALTAALGGCGSPKPPPVVPAGELSCEDAAARVKALGCPTSPELVLRLCRNIAGNNPQFATCVARAPSCPGVDDCGVK